jgi:hypothetical protein
LALTAPSGIYNIVDDDPSPVSRWLPEFARWLGAPAPPRITEEQAREAAGEDAVYYGTKLDGASNEKAKRTFAFSPRRLEWLSEWAPAGSKIPARQHRRLCSKVFTLSRNSLNAKWIHYESDEGHAFQRFLGLSRPDRGHGSGAPARS